MSFARVNGITLHYRVSGAQTARPIVLVNSLGTDARIWDDFIVELSAAYRVISYDKRGHGLSDAVPGPYSIEDHVGDLLGLADHLAVGRFGLIGVSVGGLIAQATAARHGARVAALMLCDTAAKIGDPTSWEERIVAVKAGGLAAIADTTMERWFSGKFRRDHPSEVAGWRNMLLAANRDGYCSTCATLRDTDLTGEAMTIRMPTLVVVGEHDLSTPPELVRRTAALVPGSRFEIIPDAGHIPSIERPGHLANLALTFMGDSGYA